MHEQAVEAAGSLDHEAIRNALANIDTRTLMGPVKFDETGRNVGTLYCTVQRQNGTLVLVGPKEAAPLGAEVWYPQPAWDQR